MRSLKLTLSYDGTRYAGWQVQPDQPTVQLALERALTKITGETIRTCASGRTDAGVHALAQVVSLETDSKLSTDVLRRALCAELPEDVAVLAVEEAAEGFHAIRDATAKRYRYEIDDGPVRDVFRRQYTWQHPGRLNAEAMHVAGQALVGKHDFASFQSSGSDRATTVRTVSELFVRRGEGEGADRITTEVAADGFLYNMVRAIVGTLVEVGRGAQGESWPAEVLAASDRRRAGPTAPPQGLTLVRVGYDGGG